jgi:hypothetical protein
VIEEGYTADLSALQHLPEHEEHHDAFEPTCATTGVNPEPGPGDNPFGVHHPLDEDPDHRHDGPDHGGPDHGGPDHGGEDHEKHDHGPENLAAHEPLPEPEPYGVGH